MKSFPTLSINRIHRFLMMIALGILLFYFLVYVTYAINLINFPFDYDQGEGFELVDTIMFSKGQWPYQNTEVFPFYSSNYPPLFHVIAAPLVPLFGTSYAYGRLLGFLGTLVTASTIGYAVFREGRNRWIAVLSGLAFLASNTIYHIGPLFRQHATMVLFETLAIVVLAHVNENTNPKHKRIQIALGFGLILAAGYTKQLAAITALAAGLFLFIRQPRRAFGWGILAAIIGGLIFIGMNWATNGEWWRQAILANVNEMKIIQTVALFKQWFGLHGFLVVPAVLLVIYEVYWDRFSIYAIWFVLATAINGAASGTWGGGDSYFSTAIAATCILSGIFAARSIGASWKFPHNYLDRIIQPFRTKRSALTSLSLLLIPLLYIGYGRAVLHLPTSEPVFSQIAQIFNIHPNAMNGFYDSARTQDGQYATGYANIGHLTTQADIDAGWHIVELIRATDKPVISEDAGFTLMAGRPAITNPTQLLNLEKKGLYKGDELTKMLNEKAFGLIILRAQFYPDVVLQSISRNYSQTSTITMNGFNYLILQPKS